MAKFTTKVEPAINQEQLIEDVIKRLTPVPNPKHCYNCGGNHLLYQCPTLPQPAMVPVKQLKWCRIEQKWGNHATEDCYYNKGYIKQPYKVPVAHDHAPPPPPPCYTVGNLPGPTGVKRPQPVLGQQPSIPRV